MLGQILVKNIILDLVITYFISIFTLYIIFKISNEKSNFKISKAIIIQGSIIIIVLICEIIKMYYGFSYKVIGILMLLSLFFTIYTKKDFLYSILITSVSLSINYIFFIISVFVNFLIMKILYIENSYLNMVIIIISYIILLMFFHKAKRLKRGMAFLQKKIENDYFDILILNVSATVVCSIIILSNYNELRSRAIGTALIIFSIIMFITIQKSIQLYYKQKLLIQDLEETKKELEEKKEEIKKLEQENLSFSKKSHSTAHKQKALEHKLNEILLLKTELGSETNIKEKIDKISEEISKNKPQVELSKTNIEEIDDMLKYMQSKCIKNNIDFDLQIIGNIYQMTNNYISKEKLEILLADHVKNAIIAINYSDNINKSILVRLGKIDGFYSLYIYDSGIEFEINTLLNLGVKPSTTHKSSGGTGMGFMNTFDTVKEYKASFILEEYGKPSKDEYTKAIMIKFDKKEDFKIISYRKEEIENEAKGKKLNFILNKRNNI